MAILSVITVGQDTNVNIMAMDELRAAVPESPPMPSIYSLSFSTPQIQVDFGMPDQLHHMVTLFSAYGVEKKIYDTIEQARSAFLELAQSAL